MLLRRLLDHVDKTIGRDAIKWPPTPAGYRDEAEAALLDSIFSLRAVYGRSAVKGPRAVVERWRAHVGRPLNDFQQMIDEVEALGGVDGFRAVLKSNAVAVPNSPDRPTKALAVYTSASALLAAGIRNARDVVESHAERPMDLLRAIRRGRGVGRQAATYFLMNLGLPGVKADVMINRFVDDALERHVSDVEAAQLVTILAEELQASVLQLDHAIWHHGSAESRLRRTSRRTSRRGHSGCSLGG